MSWLPGTAPPLPALPSTPAKVFFPDADRRFEVLWSVDPLFVQDAAMICVRLARSLSPCLGRLEDDFLPGSAPASADLHRAMGMLNRMTGYLGKREH